MDQNPKPQAVYSEAFHGWLLRGVRQPLPEENVWSILEAGIESARGRIIMSWIDGKLDAEGVLELTGEIAKRLRSDRPIGVHVPRSPGQVLAVLGVLRAGGVYVPIDIDLPAARRDYILSGTWLDQLISWEPTSPPGFDQAGQMDILGTRLFLHARRPELFVDAHHPQDCYIAFTSGSTGPPKGAIVPHPALANRLLTLASLLDLSSEDRMLYKASAAFDVHIWEMLISFVAGAAIVIAPVYDKLNVGRLARFIRNEKVTIAVFIPSLLDAMLYADDFLNAETLRVTVCGGEAWGRDLAQRFYGAHRSSDLYNGYGPTEVAIGVANWKVPRPGEQRIQLGPPMPNVNFLICADMSSADAEVEGELLIGGAQLARAYVGGVHADRFVEMKDGDETHRFYRSGDHVILTPATGEVLFIGRKDHQIKLSGVRLELGEIEAVFNALADVSRTVVIDLEERHTRRICLLYTTRSGNSLSKEDIAQAVDEVPGLSLAYLQTFHETELPSLPSGKVDRSVAKESVLAKLGDS